MQGLDDVVAADTVLSEVDGEAGRLVIRGRSLDSLAGVTRFEDVARRLWDGFLAPLPDDLAPPRFGVRGARRNRRPRAVRRHAGAGRAPARRR